MLSKRQKERKQIQMVCIDDLVPKDYLINCKMLWKYLNKRCYLEINEKQPEEIRAAWKSNQNKKVEKRLQAIELRGQGKSRKEIQEVTGFSLTDECRCLFFGAKSLVFMPYTARIVKRVK